ncbi:MAG: DASS family sodium-coupled anion symporter [Actinomycetaceae bacterium]|nr:DASS family sodium-coupled anion symporter [Actinomycetaceae bacterium]
MSVPVVHPSTAKAAVADYIPPSRTVWYVRVAGLLAGIGLALLVYLLMPANAAQIAAQSIAPDALKDMNLAGMPIVAAVAVLMGVWWMTEAIPLAATALIPMVIFPLLQVDTFKGTAAPYASDTIYLFMGGFVLALAMQRWNLHRRIALSVVLLVGTKPRQLILGFMVATGFLSMWVSNTATAVMMLPIGMSVLQLVDQLRGTSTVTEAEWAEDVEEVDDLARDSMKGGAVAAVVQKGRDTAIPEDERTRLGQSKFGIALMLGIAYSASIGSLGTVIGTPPNALMVAYLKESHNISIGFGQWMLVGVPLAVTFLLLGWVLLTFVLFKPEIKEIPGGRQLIRDELGKLGKMGTGETLVAIHFAAAALLWVFLPFVLKSQGINIKGIDTIIGMGVALLLFIIPADAKNGVRLINWDTMKDLPWDILLLFGGGLALSGQFSHTGLSIWVGHSVEQLRGLPVVFVILLVTAVVLGLTELTSNTATAAAFLPIVGGIAMGLEYTGNNVLLFIIPTALAATCAFMLPVATPPNAIAYGSGYVRIVDMMKAGVWFNVAGLVMVVLAVLVLAVPVFGLSLVVY